MTFTGKVLESINVDPHKARKRLANELSRSINPVSLYFNALSRMLANSAYEAIKDQVTGDHRPILEFFRHVRNGVSHGNKLFFKNWEPARPAAWRTLTIDHTLKGDANPLQGTPVFEVGETALLHSADILLLLADIERECCGGTGGKMV